MILNGVVLDALAEHRIAQAKKRRVFETACGPGSYQDGGLVFAREDGHFLDPDAFGRLFKRRVKSAGVSRKRVHDMRHTAATIMLEAGNDLKTVSDQLRHANFSTTAHMYFGPIPTPQKKAAQAMDDLLGLSDRARNARFPIDTQKDVQ